MREIQPEQLAAWLAQPDADAAGRVPAAPVPLLLDVREHWEYALCALAGSLHVPMREIPARLSELDPAAAVVCICHHGVRSAQVAMFLEHRGFDAVFNLTGGIDAWVRRIDPTMPVY